MAIAMSLLMSGSAMGISSSLQTLRCDAPHVESSSRLSPMVLDLHYCKARHKSTVLLLMHADHVCKVLKVPTEDVN